MLVRVFLFPSSRLPLSFARPSRLLSVLAELSGHYHYDEYQEQQHHQRDHKDYLCYWYDLDLKGDDDHHDQHLLHRDTSR